MKYPDKITFQVFQNGEGFTATLFTEPLMDAINKQFTPEEKMEFVRAILNTVDDDTVILK